MGAVEKEGVRGIPNEIIYQEWMAGSVYLITQANQGRKTDGMAVRGEKENLNG